jgi:hypothetical protein
MQSISTDVLKVGGIFEFKSGPLQGSLYKIIDRKTFIGEALQWIRLTITPDTKDKKDECIVEFYPEQDARHIYVFKHYNGFPKAAQSFPPPADILVEETGISYHNLDKGTPEGFEATYNGMRDTVTHWEYEDETGENVLQIFLEKDYVDLYTGVVVNIENVEVY